MTKIYVTKYALTNGILEHNAKIDEKNSMAIVPGVRGAWNFTMYFHGKDWHLTKEAAIARAEEMRIKRLKSLDKQIKKISALVFSEGQL